MTRVAHHQVEVFPSLLAGNAHGLQREILGGNKTSSLADPHFAEYREGSLTPQQARELKSWSFCFNRSRPSIEGHLERRVSHVFMQAVLCYRTGYRFREGHTIHQGLGAHHISLGGGEELKFEAAHSATLPCLYAYSETTQEESVFLYRSGFFDESNATIDVLKAVNEADSALDWMDASHSLRSKMVGLLNRAAKGELTPEEVSKQFALQLLETIEVALQNAKKEEVKDVLALYREQAELLWSYVDHPDHIDRWLNLDLEDPFCKVARAAVDRARQGDLLSRAELLQLIKAKVDELPVILHQERHQTRNESRAPVHFYDLFFLQLFEKVRGDDAPLLEEAIGVSSKSLAERARAFQRTGKTKEILVQNGEKIEGLVAELQPLFARLRGEGGDQLTGLSPEKKVSLRPGVYRQRYQMIRADQEAQSAVKSKIESIWHRIQRAGGTAYLEDFFHRSLLARAPDEKMGRVFCKLLSISSVELAQKIQEIKVNRNAHSALEKNRYLISKLAGRVLQLSPAAAQREIGVCLGQLGSRASSIDLLFYKRLFNFMDTPQKKGQLAQLVGRTEDSVDRAIAQKSKSPSVERTLQNYDAEIQEILDVATREVQQLQAATQAFRRQLMVELRRSHGMSQDHFKAIYKQRFPQSPMSDGTLSNLENGGKPIDAAIIGQVSSIFGVQEDLFYPSHFAG